MTLLIALLWWLPGCAPPPPPAPTAAAAAYYTCPMHPSVHEASPGRCPICGMDLVPVDEASGASGAVQIDAERRRDWGIRTHPAELASLTRVVRVAGTIGWDLRRQHDVSPRATGWVEGLRVAVGSVVRRGDALFLLRSPQLDAAQRDLLALGAPARDGARARLLSLGMTNRQVDAVIASGQPLAAVPVLSPDAGVVTRVDVVEGSPISPGAVPIRIADAANVWLDATVSDADAALLPEGAAATVAVAALPGQEFEGVVRGLPSDGTPTQRVRVEVANADGALRPGLVATAEISVPLEPAVVVPSDAVVYAGRRRVVFVEDDDGHLSPREVQTGARVGDQTIIVAGLVPGEAVVAQGNFLVAADSRLRAPDWWAARTDEAP